MEGRACRGRLWSAEAAAGGRGIGTIAFGLAGFCACDRATATTAGARVTKRREELGVRALPLLWLTRFWAERKGVWAKWPM